MKDEEMTVFEKSIGNLIENTKHLSGMIKIKDTSSSQIIQDIHTKLIEHIESQKSFQIFFKDFTNSVV